jgi:hypothetical protein
MSDLYVLMQVHLIEWKYYGKFLFGLFINDFNYFGYVPVIAFLKTDNFPIFYIMSQIYLNEVDYTMSYPTASSLLNFFIATKVS